MPRRATGPVYFPTKKGYFVTINGVRHRLATGPKDDPEVERKAHEAYHTLQLATLTGELKGGDTEPCFKVLNAYAVWVDKNRAPLTARNRKAHLQWFSDSFGHIKCRDLTQGHAERHMDSRPSWGAASKDMFLTTIIACFNWAKKRGYISKNPFAGMEKPVVGSRAKCHDDYISDVIHARVMAEALPTTRDLLVALDETGARPGELYILEARHYHPDRGVLQPERSKNMRYEGKRGRKPRTIYVTETLRPIIERLVAAHPTGALFRNSVGNAWDRYSLDKWFEDVRNRLNLTGRITPNMYRHRFITRALQSGVRPAKVAELVDTSINTIERHYAHLDFYGDDLRAELSKLEGGRRARPGTEAGG